MGNSQTQTKTKTKKSKTRKPRSDSESSDDSESGSSSDESAVKQTQTPKAKAAPPAAPKILERPTFSVDETKLDSGRYELWSVRLPASIPIQDLDNCDVFIPSSAAQIVPGGPVLAENGDPTSKPMSFPTKDGTKYSLRWGHSVENDAFRILLPQEQESKDSDDDDNNSDEEEAKKKAASNPLKFLQPSSAPFQRHLNVVSYVEEVSETKLAPGLTNAPKPSLAEGTKMRIAYDSVPQRPNLKRRWMPLGSTGAARVAQTTLEQEASSDKPGRKRSSSQMSDHEPQKKATSKRKRTGSTSSKTKTEENLKEASTGGKMNKRKRAESTSSHTKNGAHPAVPKKEDDDSSSEKQSPVKEESNKDSQKSEKKARKASKDGNEAVDKEIMSSGEDATPVKKEENAKESKAERKTRKAEKKARKAEKKAKKEKKQKKVKKEVKEEG